MLGEGVGWFARGTYNKCAARGPSMIRLLAVQYKLPTLTTVWAIEVFKLSESTVEAEL